MEIPQGNDLFQTTKKQSGQNYRNKYPKRRRRHNLKRKHWTLAESRHYLTFLQQHRNSFQDFRTKKEAKVFVNLSKQIRSRTISQVKSHHQKMMIKFGSISNIILTLLEEQKGWSKDPQTYLDQESSEGNHPFMKEKLEEREEKKIETHYNSFKVEMQPTSGRLLPGFQFSLEKDLLSLKFQNQSYQEYLEARDNTFLQ